MGNWAWEASLDGYLAGGGWEARGPGVPRGGARHSPQRTAVVIFQTHVHKITPTHRGIASLGAQHETLKHITGMCVYHVCWCGFGTSLQERVVDCVG